MIHAYQMFWYWSNRSTQLEVALLDVMLFPTLTVKVTSTKSACLQAEFVIPSDEITERIATENSPVNVKE